MSQSISKTQEIARDIEAISLAYSRSLNAMNNLIQMQIQDILDVSLEVRRELIEIDELETYLEDPEFEGLEAEDDEAESEADESEMAPAADHAANVAAATEKTVNDAKAEMAEIADKQGEKKGVAGGGQTDPLEQLIAAATHSLTVAMNNTLNTQNQLNSVAIAALTEGLALIYGYDDDEEIDLMLD